MAGSSGTFSSTFHDMHFDLEPPTGSVIKTLIWPRKDMTAAAAYAGLTRLAHTR